MRNYYASKSSEMTLKIGWPDLIYRGDRIIHLRGIHVPYLPAGHILIKRNDLNPATCNLILPAMRYNPNSLVIYLSHD